MNPSANGPELCESESCARSDAVARSGAHDLWFFIAVCLALTLVVLAVFGQTLRFGFVNYDDDLYVFDNPQITGGLSFHSAIWAFTHVHGGNWHPLTTLTHMLDCQLYGLHPWGHHLGNVFLHAATVILLFVVLRQMTGALWRSAFVAAVFAIHPLRAESVAWVSERKDVLSGLFFMLTLWAYVRYVRSARSHVRYLTVLCFFALGLLCKPMLVTLPFVLLLLDYWPLGRLQQIGQLPHLLREKVPFFVLSAVSCVTTVIAQKGAIQPREVFPFATRVANALVAYAIYLGKLFYPAKLALLYPMFRTGPPVWQVVAATVLLGAISVGVFVVRSRQPFLVVGWLWYLGLLVPVIGIIQVGQQAYADRYTYLPQIGLLIGGTWAGAEWAGERSRRRLALSSVAVVALCVLLVVAYQQTSYWRDSVTLWSHTLDCTKNNSVAHDNLGAALSDQGKRNEAIQHFERALELRPGYAEARYNLGNALVAQGKLPEAIQQYEQALRLKPDYAEACNNLGIALIREGKVEEAIQRYEQALKLKPTYADACMNLGVALANQGKFPEAIQKYEQALQLKPGSAEAYYDLGNALAGERKLSEAVQQYERALRLKPDYAQAYNNLGIALADEGKLQEAIQQYRRALQLKLNYPEAYNNLGVALAAQGKLPEAIEQYQRAVQLEPDYAEVWFVLGNALIQQGKQSEAIEHYKRALQLKPDNAKACYNLGNALADQGKMPEAIEQYERAVQLKSDYVEALNNLAYMLATSPNAQVRNGVRALALSEKANQLTGAKNPAILGTLAAAYAEEGRYREAVETVGRAIERARLEGDSSLAATLESQLKRYNGAQSRQGK